jgi:predicted nuclease with TOPRIM domain
MSDAFDNLNMGSEEIANSCGAGLRYIFERGALLERISRLETSLNMINEEVKNITQSNPTKELEYLEKRLNKLEVLLDKLSDELSKFSNIKEEIDTLKKSERETNKNMIKQGVKLGLIMFVIMSILTGSIGMLFNVLSKKLGG